MSLTPQQVITGWVHCVHGRAELVGITMDVRDQLSDGRVPCPACQTSCRPTFEMCRISEDITLSTWRDGQWKASFVLR